MSWSARYRKDRNTNTIEVVDECAEAVRLIFDMYIGGMGLRKIAAYLNEQGYKSPAYYQKLHYNKSVPFNKTKIGKQYVWSDTSVMKVLQKSKLKIIKPVIPQEMDTIGKR